MRIIATIATALGLLTAPLVLAQDAEPTRGEARLAKMLEGRAAGEPRSCIRAFSRSANITIIDETALVVRDGRRLWVNIPADPESLDDDDFLVIRLHGSQLCNSDIITTRSRGGGFYTGNIFLGKFVPYEREDG